MRAISPFVLAQMFRLESKEQRSLQAMGVFVMVCVFHNFVHCEPGVFQTVFSPDWMQQVHATTKPNSIFFRGVSFVFDSADVAPEADPEPAGLEIDLSAEGEVQAGALITLLPGAAKVKPKPKKARMPSGAKFESAPAN
jgi:hypothetical protein